jgi:hypothetical protein
VPSRVIAYIAAVVALAVAVFAVWTNQAGIGNAASRLGLPVRVPTADRSPEPAHASPTESSLDMATQPAPPLLTPTPVDVTAQGFLSWAMLDRQTGTITGSANFATATNSTESMIKAWISADYLRRLGTTQPLESRLNELTRMIRDSDDDAAEDIYNVGGRDAVVRRMISICELTETSIFNGWWSRTQVSARDAVRLGGCVADGRAAGAKWTPWLLGEMRQVRGEGRFGIIDALPPTVTAQTAIKNGWTIVGNQWHLNCLALVDRYALAVLTRYPSGLGISYGAGLCRDVTTKLESVG